MASKLVCVFALAIGFAGTLVHAQEDPELLAMLLDEAALACRNHDIDGFVAVFIESDAVRKAYTARELTLVRSNTLGRSVSTVAGQTYAEFPLAVFDYYYTTAEGVDEDGYTHVLMTKDLSPDNQLRVDWVRVTYDGNSEGGDDPGAIIAKGAERGALLFSPTATCWELVTVETTLP